MKDKAYHINAAKEFQGEGSCYIHTEMKNGRNCETVLCGDMIAMLHGIGAEINRLSELTHTTFEDTLVAVNASFKIGLENAMEIMKGEDRKVVEGHDWEEEWKAEKEKELSKQANLANLALKAKLKELEEDNISVHNQMEILKKKHKAEIKERDNRIQELTKELIDLEHRFDKQAEELMFGKGKNE